MAKALHYGVVVIPRATSQYFPLLPAYQQAKKWSVIRLVLCDILGGCTVIHCVVLLTTTLMAV
jgi:hypothetical protein